ncbi:isochorismate synthase [Nodosilinea sp. FACHB-131]|uniref:isochorismate synthase n=1 Tax=Cyanophyceae TaxID=3028117 RepID=UPI0011150C75|nr:MULTISPECIES: isochorismate synthase [Cyanophyceae]MBD1876445.1 isochorismate synthase [Nodosilinea sp. FACHB-131]MBD2232823.1 isochorismate synthase [Phormidium tenue FACHB-1052]
MKGLNLSVFGYFFDGLMQYFAEPVSRIFGPDDDNYPKTGVQPFDGDTYAQTVETL